MVSDFNKQQFLEVLALTTKENIILFCENYYHQIHIVSPLGPTLANIVQCHHHSKWLKSCPIVSKLVYYKIYTDDNFALFDKPQQVLPFVMLKISLLFKKFRNFTGNTSKVL